jgi:hypothetical protein
VRKYHDHDLPRYDIVRRFFRTGICAIIALDAVDPLALTGSGQETTGCHCNALTAPAGIAGNATAVTGSVIPAAVPEPASLTLLLVGLAGLGMVVRLRRG